MSKVVVGNIEDKLTGLSRKVSDLVDILQTELVFDSTADLTTGTINGFTIPDSVFTMLLAEGKTIKTRSFHSGSNVGGAKYKFLNAADSAAAGYVDGSSRFQVRSLDVYACLVVGIGILKISQFGFIFDGSDETSKFNAALLLANNGALDLEGRTISITTVSATVQDLAIISIKSGAKINIIGAPNREFGIKLNTLAGSRLLTCNFEVDGNDLVAKGLFVENTDSGKTWFCKDISISNCKQTASTGLASGIYLSGGFEYVQFDTPIVSEILSEGGSFVSSGIRTGQNGSAVSKKIVVNNPQITGIRPGNDGDGVALLQTFPFTELGEYEINGGRFENCHKRAIKTQCWKSIVNRVYIVRTEVHSVFAGNIDIDFQYGNGEIIDPILDYSNHNTAPANGLFALNGERGETVDNLGRATSLKGGNCTVRNAVGRIPHVFSISTFDTDDVVNRPSAVGFTFKGMAEHVCSIRPLANTTFNKNIVFDPLFKDNTFEDVSVSFFELDRSGTGYAYTDKATLINNTVLSGEIPKDVSETTQVGITYDIVSNNDNIQEPQPFYKDRILNVASNASAAIVFNVPFQSSVEITAMYGSSAGDDYHAHRKSVIQVGDSAGEDLETNLHNLSSAFGGFTIGISANVNASGWEITVNKPAGSSSTIGTFSVIAVCPNGITT